ncbi:peroxiredoxin-2F, mitochondrial [Hordeum vulgare]|nr:peroxiredoxin-2F, mitochondrial [Hordeum vulgare]
MEDSMNTYDERQWVGLEEMMTLFAAGDVAIPEEQPMVVKEELREEQPVAAFPLDPVGGQSRRAMASALARRAGGSPAAALWAAARGFASVGSDIVSAAPGVSLQKARSWDEGVATKFSTTPLKDIFHVLRSLYSAPVSSRRYRLTPSCFFVSACSQGKKVVIFGLPGAYTGVCSQSHVPSYKNNIDKLKAKGIDSVICVAVNDPYVLNGWAEKLQAKDAIEFYGDLDGSFHKSLDLDIDLSAALLGRRSHRWSAFVDDGKIKALNVEKAPSDFKVSGAEVILDQI